MQDQRKKDLLRTLKEAKSKAVHRAVQYRDNNDLDNWAKWELRKEYLEGEINRFTKLSLGASTPRNVFISYTKGNGTKYFSILKEELNKRSFSVTTGFENNQNGGGLVLRNVLSQMKTSTIYVGIYTKELIIDSQFGKFWTPSVWTVEEKGMALGLELPVLLIVENGIHDHFYVKTTGAFKHCIVNNIDHFKYEGVFEAIELINDKYNRIRKKDNDEENLFDI